MARVKVCPVCHTKNQPDELFCRCNVSLAQTAIIEESDSLEFQFFNSLLGAKASAVPERKQQLRGTIREEPGTVKWTKESGTRKRSEAVKPTILESAGRPGNIPPTHLEARREPEAQATQRQGQPWLPSALARRYRFIHEFEARGAEADAFLLEDATGQYFFAKIYRRGIKPKLEVFEQISRSAREHVIQLVEYAESDGRWYELLEYAPHGSLHDLFDREGSKLTQQRVREILEQLSKALRHVHGLGIVHRDLKPENILVRALQPLDLVLADFGIASILEGSHRFTSHSRTVAYAAPEAGGGDVSRATDYWSLGIILVEMLTGQHPFAGVHVQVIMSRLAQEPVDQLTEGVPEASLKLCRGLLRRDAKKRWGNAEVDKWLKNPNDPSLVVAEEAAPARRGFRFIGRDYQSAEELAEAFAAEWQEATNIWKRCKEQLSHWLMHDLGLKDIANELEQIDRLSNLDLDAQVFAVIYALDPKRPLSFKGMELTEEKLQTLAACALQKDARASEVLRALYRSRIFSVAASLIDKSRLARFESKWTQIENRWRETVDEYERLLRQVSNHGVNVTAFGLKDDDERLTVLLASATPGNRNIKYLRAQAQKVTTRDARACPWFQDLGDPSKAAAPALLAISLLASVAEGETRRRREQEEAQRAEARAAERKAQLKKQEARIRGGVRGIFTGAIVGGIFSLFFLMATVDPQLIENGSGSVVALVGLILGACIGGAEGGIVGVLVGIVVGVAVGEPLGKYLGKIFYDASLTATTFLSNSLKIAPEAVPYLSIFLFVAFGFGIGMPRNPLFKALLPLVLGGMCVAYFARLWDNPQFVEMSMGMVEQMDVLAKDIGGFIKGRY